MAGSWLMVGAGWLRVAGGRVSEGWVVVLAPAPSAPPVGSSHVTGAGAAAHWAVG